MLSFEWISIISATSIGILIAFFAIVWCIWQHNKTQKLIKQLEFTNKYHHDVHQFNSNEMFRRDMDLLQRYGPSTIPNIQNQNTTTPYSPSNFITPLPQGYYTSHINNNSSITPSSTSTPPVVSIPYHKSSTSWSPENLIR